MKTVKEFHDTLIGCNRIILSEYLSVIPELVPLEHCMQSPKWHAEGNVLMHTQMVLDVAYDHIQSIQNPVQRVNVYLACLLHDIGKPEVSFWKADKDGSRKIVAYGHEAAGVWLARDFLRKYFPEFGFGRREWITSLVENHLLTREIMGSSKARQKRFSLDVNVLEAFHVANADSLGRKTLNGPIDNSWAEAYKTSILSQFGASPNGYEVPQSDHLSNFAYSAIRWKILYGKLDENDTKAINSIAHQIDSQPPFQLLLLIGAPGSGKTTYRETLYPGVKTICMDDERKRLCGTPNDMSRNQEVYDNCFHDLISSLKKRENVIWDATSYCKKARFRLIDEARKHGALIGITYFDIPLPLLLERNAGREKVVGEEIVSGFYKKLESPKPYEYDQLLVVNEHTPLGKFN